MFELDFLRSAAPGYDIRFIDTTASTNTALLEAADARAGTALVALSQSAGRGRMGRSFASPEGGLYMSLLLEPASAEDALLILRAPPSPSAARLRPYPDGKRV